MLNKQKKGFLQLLLNPIVLLLLALILIILFLPKSPPFRLAILKNVEFAGFAFSDNEEINKACGQAYGGFSSNIGGGGITPLIITANGGSIPQGKRFISTDITNIDEILVIYEGFARCNPKNTGANIYAIVSGSGGGEIKAGKGASCSSAQDFQTFQPALWKFKNNFDGTWSYLESLGVGDVFIVKSTSQISGFVSLSLGASVESSCGDGGSGYASITLYNLVRKENAFAVCKADEYLTTDETGKQICKSLATIVLNSEEAIKESFDEKLIRITAELEAKNQGLTSDITALSQQLANQQSQPSFDDTSLRAQINQLEMELKETKSILADVQAGDKKVIAVIESQEQFEKPGIIKNLWNRLIAWIKNLLF